MKPLSKVIFIFLLLVLLASFAFAKESSYQVEGVSQGDSGEFAVTFFWIAVILIAAKVSSLVMRFGQPAVLGELVIGVVLGNLALVGIHFFDVLRHDQIILFLAELGVVILLFQIGLESKVEELQKVGFRATLVAIVGVVIPFAMGTFLGPYLLPNLSFNTYLFLGAALTATSVGITARVFKDLGKLNIPEAKIVLGAAVIDDILGLVILAVVSAIITIGTVSAGNVAWIITKAVLFLVGSIVVGQLAVDPLSKGFSKIQSGIGMKFTLAICFGLIFAYIAYLIGLAPIVGAFAAGLILKPVHFKYFKDPHVVEDIKQFIRVHDEEHKSQVDRLIRKYSDHHIEDIVEPIGLFFVPIFFVMTGFAVDLSTLFDMKVLAISLALTAIAILGKVLAGFVAGNVKKWIVGWGMVPRGEVGLIFATIGKGLGVVTDTVFSVIVIMVILTTLMTPPILGYLLKKE